MKRTIALATMLALVVIGCGSGGEATTTTEGAAPDTTAPGDTTAAAAEGASVGMALAAPQNDQGFAQAHYEGLVAAQEQLGVAIAVQENVVDPQARVDALRDLAADNDLVIGVGAEFAEAGVVVAPQFPDVEFMVINGEASDAPNLHVYGLREGVPAYIAGVVAAEMTETDTAGFVGGEEIPPLEQALTGFTAGINSAGTDVEMSSTVVGSFSDPQGAYAAASAQIASGAEVIYAYVDSGIAGVIEAIEDSGEEVLVFAIIFPRCDDFPHVVGTSVINASANVVAMVNDHLQGTIPDEPTYRGVELPDVQRFELCPDYQTPELQQLVDETTGAINNGEIELPEGV